MYLPARMLRPYALACLLAGGFALGCKFPSELRSEAARDAGTGGPELHEAQPLTAEPLLAQPLTAQPLTAEPLLAGPLMADARLTQRTLERAEQLIVGEKTFDLPPEDLPLPQASDLAQNRWRVAYRTKSGHFHVLYIVPGHAFPGPRVDALAWEKVPTFELARKKLYEEPALRTELFAAIRESRGDIGLAGFLFELADGQDDGEWVKAADTLNAPGKAELVRLLMPSLTALHTGTTRLRRAAQVCDLRSQPEALHARLLELTQLTPVPEPFAIAIMLRALIGALPKEAAALGCKLAQQLRRETAATDPLSAAAALAVLGSGVACPALNVILEADPCAPALRCTDQGPVNPHATSNQDEPLCTLAQIEVAKLAELARSARSLSDDAYSPAAAFAFAASQPSDATPLMRALSQAHARRRYRLSQPKSPACDGDPESVKDGASCNCSEASIRLAACRAASPASNVRVRTGTCAFALDDARKTLSQVQAARTPIIE
jgi:hypothetical protein